MRYDFNLADAYCLLQNEGPDHLLEKGAISIFVQKCGQKFSTEDESRIIRRFDHDGDGKIGYNDFAKMVLPSKQNYYMKTSTRWSNSEPVNLRIKNS